MKPAHSMPSLHKVGKIHNFQLEYNYVISAHPFHKEIINIQVEQSKHIGSLDYGCSLIMGFLYSLLDNVSIMVSIPTC